MPTLTPELKTAVLKQLNLPQENPSTHYLDRLLVAYTETVPWESAFRIVRRDGVTDTAVCPRWPELFWQDNLERGGGGTCFESNYAFFALLQSLGFCGYLTINNMGDSIGCHTAIVIVLAGQKWLVDAGLPIFAPLPISSRGVSVRATPFSCFAVRPDGQNQYQVERWPHPQRNAFTFIDQPVDEETYRQAVVADYGVHGLFLDRVIVNKVIAGKLYRFNMGELPWRINQFAWGIRSDIELWDVPETAVAQHFNMDEQTIRNAFALTSPQPPRP